MHRVCSNKISVQFIVIGFDDKSFINLVGSVTGDCVVVIMAISSSVGRCHLKVGMGVPFWTTDPYLFLQKDTM